MSLNSEEIYREKYLKYKKKYTLALENMEGGVELKLSEKTKIYFVAEKTFHALMGARRESINPEKCFNERLVKPYMSLLLEKSVMSGWNLIRADKKKAYIELNKPFLGGLKFGIEQKYKQENDKTEIIEESFNDKYAETQLQNYAPYILNCFNYANRSSSKLTEIYYLYVQDNKVSYKGKLEQGQGTAQRGGADPNYIFCNESVFDSLKYHYGNFSSRELLINTSCIEDIVQFPAVFNTSKKTYEPINYGIVKIGDTTCKFKGDPSFDLSFLWADDQTTNEKQQKFGYKAVSEDKGLFNKKTKLVYTKNDSMISQHIKKILLKLKKEQLDLNISKVIKYDDKNIFDVTPDKT